MINLNEQRTTAILFPCGICNLNCRYCTIDKNPILQEIDKELEQSFIGDYYFNRIKEYFPRKDQLRQVETWGGEPFLHMDRIYQTVHSLIDYYPYFNFMFSSTNFSYDEWLSQFMGLMNCFAAYPYRKFAYMLQLSVDGPTYINDNNRGKGVTEKCIKNFDKLIEVIKEDKFPSNVDLTLVLKGTWDISTIHLLNDKDKLIEFFQFYETNYVEKVFNLHRDNVCMNLAIPNTAVPAPVTKLDGQIFSELIAKCKEIEQENSVQQYFKFYQKITPFSEVQSMPHRTYCSLHGTCGSGTNMLGFLPMNRIAVCHEGFTELADAYKSYASKRSDKNLTVNLTTFLEESFLSMCLTDEQYAQYETKMNYYECPDTTARLATNTAMIVALAMAEEIDSKYLNEEEALKAAIYLHYNGAYCVKNNYNINGSLTLEPVGFYKLMLNGAVDQLMEVKNFAIDNDS